MTVTNDTAHDLSSGIDLDKYDIKVQVSENAPNVSPTTAFDECDFPDFLLRNIRSVGFVKPTPVQRRGMPLIQKGRVNMLIASQSGSGKTATYLLPIIAELSKSPRLNGDPRAVVLVPTRELAIQVESMAHEFIRYSNLRVCIACGGRKVRPQIEKLEAGCDILVATPGRLEHLLDMSTQVISLTSVRYFVLDEAAKLLGNMFSKEMKEIEQELPPKDKRQTILVSRSSEEIYSLVLLSEYVVLDANSADGAVTEIDIIRREFETNPLNDLVDTLRNDIGKRTLIVVSNRNAVELISQHLNLNGIENAFIHGMLDQSLREAAVNTFRSGDVTILITSGVMGMGLDLKHLNHVIDYNRRASVHDFVLRLDHTNVSVRSKITFFKFPKALESKPPSRPAKTIVATDYPRVRQTVINSPQNKKAHLMSLLGKNPTGRTLIFCQPRAVREIVSHLKESGIPTTFYATPLDSKNLEHFKSHANYTLVTTDAYVLEKLKIQVDRVINFILPPFEKYVEIASAVNCKGHVISFYHRNRDSRMVDHLRRLLVVTNQKLPSFLGGVQ